MKLTKLEINGFKSFAKKTELVFENGVTGILGPNGCGKSNIADAFRFVLGEQSARALRGKKVEDFIFGGTEKRKPLSYCEVSMHFDNSDGVLASPYSEVVVSRRAFRSGESEYYINKTACRLRDIQDLFRDTGIGKDGYSIIGQGRVGEILSDRSNERRIVFEEAAGVMKYRTRKEEAERKLQNTSKNLVRLEDILRELEERVEPLREQSEKATAYFKLREELRELELNLFVQQYDKSTERIKLIKENSAQLEDELNEAQAENERIGAELSSRESAERGLSETISSVSQQLIALSATVESGLGDEKLLAERIASVKREIEQHEKECGSIEARRKFNLERLDMLSSTVAGFSNDTSSLEAKLSSANEKLDALQRSIDDKEAEIEAKKQAMMDEMNRLADTRSRASRLEAIRESMNSRLSEIESEKSGFRKELEKLNAELGSFGAENKRLNDEKAAVLSSRSSAAASADALEKRISAAAGELRRCEDEINSIHSRRKVLEEMKRAHEGYYTSVKRLLGDAARDPRLGERIHGVVAELISVPREYERAIEMALGAALQNIIVPTEQDAKYVINHLRSHEYGRATLLPVSTMRSRLLTGEERSFISVDGCFGVASDLIGFSPAYKGVIENLLGRTVIVRDIDTGILINKRAHSSFRIATLEGDILNPGGSMTGGSVQKREFSLLGREREIDELDSRLKKTSARAQELKTEGSSLTDKLFKQNAIVHKLDEQLKSLELSLASISEKIDITEKYVQKNTESLTRLDDESARVSDSIGDIERERVQASGDESRINEKNAVSGEDIRASQQELNELRALLKSANTEATDLQVLLMASTKEKGAAEAEIIRLEGENDSLHTRLDELNADTEKNKHAISEFEKRLAEIGSTVSADKEKTDALGETLKKLETERGELIALLDELREKREALSHTLDELKERLHKNELTSNKLSIELDNMTARIWQDYELTYDGAQTYRKEGSNAKMHSRCDELRRSIKALGEVNTSSIEDYRSVKERYEELSAQCADLQQAKTDLNELIGELTDTMERSFNEQFELIQRNFSSTFVELFGGGHAELVLSDKNDVLNSNIDIIAQPPGKKLQLLTLLSGGEQALTAIALLFAILKLKPAAFCILDEIDSALDEANVDCFANYLSDYAKGTQFIIITHRKGAMAVCDSLYGVSMEEKGVSSLVSAKFD